MSDVKNSLSSIGDFLDCLDINQLYTIIENESGSYEAEETKKFKNSSRDLTHINAQLSSNTSDLSKLMTQIKAKYKTGKLSDYSNLKVLKEETYSIFDELKELSSSLLNKLKLRRTVDKKNHITAFEIDARYFFQIYFVTFLNKHLY